MPSGLRPTPKDPRDKRFSHARLFGSVATFPVEYYADNGSMPDQMKDGRPTACTSYTVVEIGRDQDGIEYSHDYQFMKTLLSCGLPPTSQGADLRAAFKVSTVWGLLPNEDEPQEMERKNQAVAAMPINWPVELDKKTIKKPAYIPILVEPGLDWFDAIRSALVIGKDEKRTVGLGTKWYSSFKDAVLPDKPTGSYSWHAYKVSGWTTEDSKGNLIRGGEPFLKVKSWQGKSFGDNGWCYMSRELVNRLMSDWGTYAATLQDLPTGTVEELKAQQVSLMESALALMQNLLIRLQYALHR